MTLHVAAFDLSLSSTGYGRIGQDGQVRTLVKQTEPVEGDHATADRIWGIAGWCMRQLTEDTACVVLEAPSFGSEHGQQHERAALFWAVRRGLAVRCRPDGSRLPVGRIAPKTLKARVAGSGSASKADMRKAVAKLYPGQGLDRVSYDEADAVGLALLGVIRLRWPGPWLGGHAPDSAGIFEHLPDPEQPAAPSSSPTLLDPFRSPR